MGAGPLQFEADVLAFVRALPELRAGDAVLDDYSDVTEMNGAGDRPRVVVIGSAGEEVQRTVPYRPHQGDWVVRVHIFAPNPPGDATRGRADGWHERFRSLVASIYAALSAPGALLRQGRPIVRVTLDGQPPMRLRDNPPPASTRRSITLTAQEW